MTRSRRLLARALRAIAIALVLAAGAVGGMTVALRADPGGEYRTELGTVRASVVPTTDGAVTVYVPLVDWRVRLLRHRAPARIQLELQGIDRTAAGSTISSSGAAARSLDAVRTDSRRVVESALRRAVLVAAVGALLGSLLAGGVLAGWLLRRRWLLVGPFAGLVVAAAVLVPSLQVMRGLGEQHVVVTAAGGNADELPAVLRFAEQLLTVGDEYEDHYATALRSIANLASFASAGGSGSGASGSMLVVSDLHDNVFVLDALDAFAGDSTVLAAGDFVQVGAAVEQRTAADVARLGGRVVAVSGNHDTPEYMRSLRDAGATVLDADRPTTTLDPSLQAAGWPDPLERDEDSDGSHRLRVYGEEYRRQRADFLAWFDALEERPDVVLVHQHGFAHALVDELERRGDDRPLLVVTGHDHEAHVHADGPHVIVDGGTIGAGGLAAIGEQDASFARLVLRDGQVVAVDVIAIEPLTGAATSRRTRLAVPVGPAG